MRTILVLLACVLTILSSCRQNGFNDEQFKFKLEDGAIIVSNLQTTYRLETIRSDIVKTTFLPNAEEITDKPSYFIVLEKEKGAGFKVDEFDDKLQLQTGEMIVEITKSPFVVNYYNNKKEPILITSKTLTDSVGYKTMHFHTPSNERFYGMGQKSIPVNRRGYAFDTRNFHVGGYTKEYATMQVNIPYIYTSGNYGVFFDNTYTGYFDLAKSNPEEWSYRVDGGNYAYFVTIGENLLELQNKYYDLTGYPTIPPK